MPDGGAHSGTTAPYIRPAVKLDFSGVDVNDIDGLTVRVVTVNGVPAERASVQMGLRILPQDEYDSIQSVMDNGLQTANLKLFDIRFDQGKNLMRGYSGSTYVVIPYGVTQIDSNSNLGRKGLISVKIPASVTIIGDYAFSGNLLTSVTVPDSVTSIGSNAFSSNRLTSIFIGNSVNSIGEYAFYSNSLISVTFPDSVTSIYSEAFYENSALRSVTIGANVNIRSWGSIGGVYKNNNSRAGTYTYNGRDWNYSAAGR